MIALSADKLMHFIVGLAGGVIFWQILERFMGGSARRINPIVFVMMVIWGASGLFFFRKLGIPLLSADWFYMAVPDWDIPLYRVWGWRFLLHRSWLFHSVLIPSGLIGLSIWLLGWRPHRVWKWLLDGAMGLSVGMAAHLAWDAVQSAQRSGFQIYGWDLTLSGLWLVANLVLGVGLPLAIAWVIHRPSAL
ncbi:MAG: hypothetical protein KME20_07165 [Kaiparowitsia implicata GSE-PSE-MK54-09C]|jgi:hypothetical protein|nr:hypothetical protein [Kaiparowitsia implicata GSE-PSE-MK54-09C]